MNLLKIFEEEIKTNTKIICLNPCDREFPTKYLTLQEYLECEDLSELWKSGFMGKKPDEFEYDYMGECKLLLEVNEYKFKDILQKINQLEKDEDIDFEELSKIILKWHFNYNDDVEVYFYLYKYFIKN